MEQVKKEMSAVEGNKAERYFMEWLSKHRLNFEYVDKWFDFLIEGQKVELKSCGLIVRNGNGSRMMGRYDFTRERNRRLQQKENIWVCLMVRSGDTFLIQGFCRSDLLKGLRYISISKADKLKMLKTSTWVKKVSKTERFK